MAGQVGLDERDFRIGWLTNAVVFGFIALMTASPILNFYMGKNTSERQDYIMERLLVPVEK